MDKASNQLNQNGMSRSSSSETEENNNNNNNIVKTKYKIIRKPEILDISSFDTFQYNNYNRQTKMEILSHPDDDGDSEVFNSVFVKLSEQTNKKYKFTHKKKTRREKIEDLKMMSIKKCGGDLEENELFFNMLKSYDAVLGQDIYESHQATHDNISGEYHLGSVRKRTLSDYEKEAFMRRDLVLTELSDSEKNYLDDLEFIVNQYIPLMTLEHVTEELLQSCDNIYMNIADIYEFHFNSFHKKIEDSFENPELLDETFSAHEEELTCLYTHYCSQKPFADDFLNTHEMELDALCKNKFPNIKLRIKDYLIKPVQRLMKYQLLLSSIKKYGVKAGKESTYLDTAIKVMERVPKEANDAMHVGLISGYNGSGCNIQQLMIHGELEVAVGKTKPRPMHVFLFETVVLFTEKASKLVPEYKCIDSQDTGTLGYTDNKELKFVIWFRKHNKTDIYICQAETNESKEKWKQKVRDAMGIKDIIKRSRSCRRQLTIEITPPSETASEKFQTLMIEEAVIKAMEGHPRLGIMTERLKSNIEKYIASEFIIPSMESNHGRLKSPYNRTRHNTTTNVSSTLSPESVSRNKSRSPSPNNEKPSKYSIIRSISPNIRRRDSTNIKKKDGTNKKNRVKSIC